MPPAQPVLSTHWLRLGTPAFATTLVLGAVLCLTPPVAASTVAPSAPDAPLPEADPELEKARAAYDQAYSSLRLVRRGISEIGRPVPGLAGGDGELAALLTAEQLLGGDPVINVDSGLGYSSLQAAINAATAGDTLRIVLDLDEGPVTVDRDLFIEGLTGAETVRPTQDTGTSGDARGWFLVDTGVALVVRGLRFDGNGFKIYQGFRHKGFGLFENISFNDIQFDPSGPLYQGTAIVAFGDRVDVVDSTFSHIGRVGVLFFGTEVVGAVYSGNRYVGKGDGDFLDYGVELNGGATGWVLGSSIQDCRGVASTDGSTSGAILATTFSGAGTAVSVISNHLLDNTNGLAAGFPGGGDSTAATAAFNRFFGNDLGLNAASSVEVAAENNWWGCNGGPGAVGCDANGVVDAGSIDADPWLILDTVSFRWVKPLTTITLKADMRGNSDDVDVSTIGLVPDGIPGTYQDDGSFGTVVPIAVESAAARWQTLYVAGPDEGESTVTLTVDSQEVETLVRVEIGLFCDDFESGDTSSWGEVFP